ncbi:DM13 domain-containing protein [Corallincola platygyrae]|uniref:DM13 domain-containing protein n=1 Tax=Corallincola platygyrae TaxID=1193278 RepID=A0ABW4XTX6_9GAMM
MKALINLITHLATGVAGFVLGIYMLPLLTQEEGPSDEKLQAHASQAVYQAEFHRDLEDSDWLHWGEGKVSVSDEFVSFDGELAPGPDYRLYLVPEFVETEAGFNAIKGMSKHIGDVDSFEDFMVAVPEGVDVHQYSTVVVWCESFGQFITAAQYKF